MAAMSLLKNLPDGYRLNPSDEQIISYYLTRKIQGIPDPGGKWIIPEIDIYEYKPQDLIPLYNKMGSINSNGLECFFFCTLGKDPNRKNRKIAGGEGFWHQTGVGRKPEDTDQRRWAKLIFCHRLGTHRDYEQTDWVMHEFRFIDDERFVLCRITKKPKKKLSVSAGKASAGKKRKVDSTSSESHQEESLESCILNDINTKKAKRRTRPSQNDNHTTLAASSEASVHVNAPEVPTIMNPLSNIVTLDDFDRPLISSYHNHPFDMSPSESMIGGYVPPLDINPPEHSTIMTLLYEPQSPWSELISSYHNHHSDMSPSVSMIGAHPPPIDINPPELPTIMTPLYEPQNPSFDNLISSHHNYHSDITANVSKTGAHPPPLDINPPEITTIMSPLSYEYETLLFDHLISSYDNLHFDMSSSVSMIGGYAPPLDVSDDGYSMFDNLFPPDLDLVY